MCKFSARRYGFQITFGALCIVVVISIILPPISSKRIANKVQTEIKNGVAEAYSDPRVAVDDGAKDTEER